MKIPLSELMHKTLGAVKNAATATRADLGSQIAEAEALAKSDEAFLTLLDQRRNQQLGPRKACQELEAELALEKLQKKHDDVCLKIGAASVAAGDRYAVDWQALLETTALFANREAILKGARANIEHFDREITDMIRAHKDAAKRHNISLD